MNSVQRSHANIVGYALLTAAMGLGTVFGISYGKNLVEDLLDRTPITTFTETPEPTVPTTLDGPTLGLGN